MVANKSLLLTAFLLFTAFSSHARFGNDPDLCFDYDEPYACFEDESGLCFWSYGENFCDVRFNAPGLCDGMPNYESCIISAGCVWDDDNNWCVEG